MFISFLQICFESFNSYYYLGKDYAKIIQPISMIHSKGKNIIINFVVFRYLLFFPLRICFEEIIHTCFLSYIIIKLILIQEKLLIIKVFEPEPKILYQYRYKFSEAMEMEMAC